MIAVLVLVCICPRLPILGQDLPQPFPVVVPKRLHFVVGNVFGGEVRIDLMNDAVIYSRTEVDKSVRQKTVQPTPIAWHKFVEKLNEAKMYSWAPQYKNSNVLDGGGWKMDLIFGKREFFSEGINDYPKDGAVYLAAKELNPSHTFEIVWTALCELVGEDPAGYPLK